RGSMKIDTKQLGDALVDAISGLAYEIGRRSASEARLDMYGLTRQTVHEKAAAVLVDYFVGRFRPEGYVIQAHHQTLTCPRCGYSDRIPNYPGTPFCARCKRNFVGRAAAA